MIGLLAHARRLAELAMLDRCDVARYVETITADGTSQSYQVIASNLPCEVMPIGHGGSESLSAAQQIQAASNWTISLPAGTDVTVRDRITVNARTFEITRVDARTFEARRDCICSEVI